MDAWQAAAAWWGALASGLGGRLDNLVWGNSVLSCFPSLSLSLSFSLFSGMICVEQKHHSTQSLDLSPGAICKTLQSNTRASYDPRQGSSAEKPHPGQGSEVKINLPRNVFEWLWHEKGSWRRFIARENVGEAVALSKKKGKGQLASIQNEQDPVYLLDKTRSLGDLLAAVVAGCWVHPHAVAKATQTFSHAQSKHVYRMLLDPRPRPPLWSTVIQRSGVQRLVDLRGTLVTLLWIWVVFSLASAGVWRSKSCETGGSWLINNRQCCWVIYY